MASAYFPPHDAHGLLCTDPPLHKARIRGDVTAQREVKTSRTLRP